MTKRKKTTMTQRKKPQSPRSKSETIPLRQIRPGHPKRRRVLPVSDREGVFVHGFICGRCGLHFNVYSWQANRHTASNVTCPECRNGGSFVHFRVCVSDTPAFLAGGREIRQMCPRSGSAMMDDSGP